MRNAIDQSYEYCRRVARRRAKNFYYSFVLLSRPQRRAMCAIYAFMRYCDDLSDEPGATRAAMACSACARPISPPSAVTALLSAYFAA